MLHYILKGGLAAFIGMLVTMPLPARAFEVGFEEVQAPDPAGPPLPAGIWYPTEEPASPHRLELFTQDVALAANVAGAGHPLVVISHGNGGSLAGHYDTALALARAGFVVAAMTHTGDNYRDRSNEVHLQDRPRHVHATIDYVLSEWNGHTAVDASKVGVFGFSAGRFTALVAIGRKPDFARIDPYCATHAQTSLCQTLKAHGITHLAPVPETTWLADPRIKAAVIAAPALGLLPTMPKRFATPYRTAGVSSRTGGRPLRFSRALLGSFGAGRTGDLRRAAGLRPRRLPRALQCGSGAVL